MRLSSFLYNNHALEQITLSSIFSDTTLCDMMDTDNTILHMYETPQKAWNAIYQDCEAAQTSITCEHYIIENDVVGHRFLELFTEKAKAGLEIILVLDGVGSGSLIGSPQIAALRAAGGQVHFYKPVTLRFLLRPWRWLPRNHNKIILIDKEIGHMGSACIQHSMRDWRDIHIRFEGHLPASLYRKIKAISGYLAGIKSRQSYHVYRRQTDTDGEMTYAISQPYIGRNFIYKTLLQHIRSARKHVLLVTPYFFPPFRLRKALVRASKRGVTVTLMLSDQSDVPIADCASRSYLPYLLRHNIRVLLYQNTILHAKYMVVDDNFAMVGSTNLDYLSLLRNHETNMILYNPDTVSRFIDQFHKDAPSCRKADWDYWHSLSWLYRLGGYIARLGRKVM